MRILNISPRYWPNLGGGENYIREISERLILDGHRVTVATSDASEAELFWNPQKRRLAQSKAEHNGVNVIRFPLRHLPLSPLSYSVWRYIVFWFFASRPGLPTNWFTWLSRFTPWTPDLWKWIDKTDEKFDVVSAIGILYEPFVAAAQKLAQRQRIPFIVYPLCHLGAGKKPGSDSVSRYYTMRHQLALVRSADRVIVMTSTEGEYYRSQGVAPERIVVAGAGVNPQQVTGGNAQEFRMRHSLAGPIVTFLSAMAYDKGATHLVEAVQQLWALGYKVELVLAGALLQPFGKFLQKLPLATRNRICLLPSISEEEKRDLLAATDVVVMPSRTDSFGIIYLEAWANRKPVIGAQAWGMSDVISSGVDGLLVPFGDSVALADRIKALLDDPELRGRYGQAGEQKVRSSYTWEKVYNRVKAIYSSNQSTL